MKSGSPVSLFTPLIVAIFALVGCSVPKEGPATITKVNPEHFYPGKVVKTTDRMVQFESLRRTHGLLDSADYKEAYGNYFSVFWVSEDKRPVTVRFDYRLGKTASQVHSKELVIDSPKSKNVTKFQVTGDEYADQGPVTQWKFSVLDGGSVITEYKSYLWK
ncbi:MAG: hypothetical protein P1U86_14185 [Verrucomicrobiales bacterium]|nr:hypothetical protein [Verrucomicrobiales bacterium]